MVLGAQSFLNDSCHFEGSEFCHDHYVGVFHGEIFKEGGFEHFPVVGMGFLVASPQSVSWVIARDQLGGVYIPQQW
ncbi:hypothetical protein DSO57_1030956 [Entomophthora muscae]|uniref:Uncharacterized protein n=1 Tax=Entomophthora muscae TaxID=34485 RepID=A0ACC2UAH6_9FUNG|nr:hypothetical protein DSO57_1030956 [Entomophthora muscae]